MCRHTVEHYRGNPVVVGFDPLIEPNSNETKTETYEPDEFHPKYAGSSLDWNVFYPEIVREIRKADKKTPILMESMNYGAVDRLPFLKTPNVMADTLMEYRKRNIRRPSNTTFE
jgi:hypothetical protein